MTVINIGNNIIGGESTDVKPANYAANTIFYEFNTGAIYEWSGSVWLQKTPGLNIANEFTETLTINKSAEQTTDEVLQEWSMSDDLNSFVRLNNASSVNGEFAPHIHAVQATTADLEAMSFDIQIGDTLDTTTIPVLTINLSKDDLSSITVRPLLDIQNNGNSVLTITPNEVDFNSKNIINSSFPNNELKIRNAADTFSHTITTTATLDRSTTLPDVGGSILIDSATQTITNKTVNATNNSITDTSTTAGDLLKGNGTKFVRFGIGTSLQYLRVNSAGTDLEYADLGDFLNDTYIELDPITAPAAPAAESRRLYVDGTTPFHLLLKKPDGSTIDIEGIASSSGEANTASNIGTGGIGVLKQKTGVNFELKTINEGGSGTIAITDDTTNNEIDIDVNATNLLLSNLGGTLTASQLPAEAVRNDQNNDLGDFYLDLGDITAPANPAAGTRRLFVDTATGELSVRTSAGATLSLESGAGGGESNTASNIGTAGVGLFDAKVGADLQFKNINAGSNKITITDDTVDDEVDIDVTEANLTLSNIGGTLLASQLPVVAVRTDQTNTFGDFDQIFTNNRLAVNNSAGTFKHLIGSAATADRTVTLPNATGNILLDSASQTITSKTIDATLNTLSNIRDSSIAAHTTTKITTLNKSLLNTAIMYEDEDNTVGAHYFEFTEIADPTTPDINKAKVYLDDSTGELSIRKDSGVIVSLEAGATGGEANTASNAGTGGIGITLAKVGIDLPFKSIAAASSKITVADDAVNKNVDIDVDESQLSLANIPGNLDDVDDVVITTPADTQVLTWDSTTSKWINEDAPVGGANTVKNDQANTFGAFDQTFKDSTINIRNPADTFGFTISAGAITADSTVQLPVTAAASDNFLLAGASNQTITGSKRFVSDQLKIWNPAITFLYSIRATAISANRILSLPQVTGDDTFVAEAHTQTLTNKTINGPDNTITNIQASSLPAAVKQYPFMWTFYAITSNEPSDGRAPPGDRGFWNSKNNASFIVLEHDIVITKVVVGVVNNSKSGTSIFSLLDDDVTVPNTTLNIAASTNNRASTGVISQAIAAGSEFSIKGDISSTGSISLSMEIHGYYDMA